MESKGMQEELARLQAAVDGFADAAPASIIPGGKHVMLSYQWDHQVSLPAGLPLTSW
jgi:hypothetical protein